MNIGTKGDVLVLTEEQRLELQRINREYLLTSPLCLQGMRSSVTATCLCQRQRTGVSPSGHGVAACHAGWQLRSWGRTSRAAQLGRVKELRGLAG